MYFFYLTTIDFILFPPYMRDDSAITVLIFIRKEIKMPKKIFNNSVYVGNCTPSGVAHQAVKVYRMSNVKNPIKTGNLAVDITAGRVPVIKSWNTGFNLGKFGFIAQQTYQDTCKRKK